MSILDDKREGIGLALLRKGITDMNTTDPELIEQAGNDLKQLTDVSNIRVTIKGYKDVPKGAIDIAHAWSGDPVSGVNSYLPEGTDASVVGWWYPKDRVSVVNNDLMLVVKGAEARPGPPVHELHARPRQREGQLRLERLPAADRRPRARGASHRGAGASR